MVIKFEIWKGKKVVAVRNNGKLVSWRYAKYKDSKESVRREIGRRGTFLKDVKRRIETFSSGTREISVTTRSKITIKEGIVKSKIRKSVKLRIDDPRSVQYVFRGKLKDGREVFARSSTFSDFSKKGKDNAREEAFNNFVFRLSNPDGVGGYDEDEGLEILEREVQFVEEGFVFYDRPKNRIKA